MKEPMKRILLYLLCLVAITSCNGAALKSLRGLIKRVPTKELVRKVPKTMPKSGKKSSEWINGIDDVVRAVSRSDSTSFTSPGVTPQYVSPKYNGDINSYRPGGNAPFKFKTIDVTIPKVDIAPNSSSVNLNRNGGGYKSNPYMGTSTQFQFKTTPLTY